MIQARYLATFDRAFRPFFLSAALFSVVAVALWILYWFRVGSAEAPAFTPLYGWTWWHAHEMIYGFAVPVIVGFLLTAVQNWTGVKTPSGTPLALLFLLWLAGRVFLLAPMLVSFPNWIISLVDVSFLLFVAYFYAEAIVKGKNWRNLFFTFILLAMALGNAQLHYLAEQQKLIELKTLFIGLVYWTLLVIVIIGGRVIPFFTSRGASVKIPDQYPINEYIVVGSVIVLALMFSLAQWIHWPSELFAFVSLIAFLSHLFRLSQWKTFSTFNIPLLWSLHIAYGFIVLSFLGMALYHLNIIQSFGALLHIGTIGGIAMLALGMITRISLGHTGRPLVVNRWIQLAYLLISVACVIRVLGDILLGHEYQVTVFVSSGVFWVISFSIFVRFYFNVLTTPRV